MLRAVLLDVGGTLWPNDLGGDADSDATVLARLAQLLPASVPARSLVALRAALRTHDQALIQDTLAVLSGALQALGAACAGEDLEAIRRALCAPAVPGVAVFSGARE